MPQNPEVVEAINRLATDPAYRINCIVMDNPSGVRELFVAGTGKGANYSPAQLTSELVRMAGAGQDVDRYLAVDWLGTIGGPADDAFRWMRAESAAVLSAPGVAAQAARTAPAGFQHKAGIFDPDSPDDTYGPAQQTNNAAAGDDGGDSVIDWTSVINSMIGVIPAFFGGPTTPTSTGAAAPAAPTTTTSTTTIVLIAVGLVVAIVVGILIYRARR